MSEPDRNRAPDTPVDQIFQGDGRHGPKQVDRRSMLKRVIGTAVGTGGAARDNQKQSDGQAVGERGTEQSSPTTTL